MKTISIYIGTCLLTQILKNQNLASCRNTFSGFTKNISIITTKASGLTKGGILNLALNIKLNILSAHITPNIAANSIKSCSERWFLGSSSKISTWFTPEDLHPYTLIPMRNINSTIRNGPLYNRNADLKLSMSIFWNWAEKIFDL